MKVLLGILLVIAGLVGFGYGLWSILSDSMMSEFQAAQLCEPSEQLETVARLNEFDRAAGSIYYCVDAQGDRRDVTERATAGSGVWMDVGSMVLGSIAIALGFFLLIHRAVQADRERGLIDAPTEEERQFFDSMN